MLWCDHLTELPPSIGWLLLHRFGRTVYIFAFQLQQSVHLLIQ